MKLAERLPPGDSLLSPLEHAGGRIPAAVRRGAFLTAYTVEVRYPALKQPLT